MSDGHEGRVDRDRWMLIAVAASAGAMVATAVLIAVFILTRATPGAAIEIKPPQPSPTHSPTATAGPLWVYVTGCVSRPGVVSLAPGSRVQDAVEAAGGMTDQAEPDAVNLAAPAFDGQHVRVPAVGEAAPTEDQRLSGGTGESWPIDINSAPVETLVELPGVGEVTAGRIVEYRALHGPFTSVEQIMDVPGIGEAKYEAMKDLITVGP